MARYYTDEANVLILIALMKHHGVKRIIASPGTTNLTFIGSVQQDSDFEVFSAPDERSAAYMACGLAAETGEPVALSCTGATASRNYLPGLTEAFYRKLPVLAITSTQHMGRVGHNVAQVIDRSTRPADVCVASVQAPCVESPEDRSALALSLNGALLELRRRGGGPVHVNLATSYSRAFDVKELPEVQVVDRVDASGSLPPLGGRRVAVFAGAHKPWSDRLVRAVDAFCEAYGAAVFCDQTSNYRGPHRALAALVASQDSHSSPCLDIDVLVSMGDVSGAYCGFRLDESWRVNPDGELRDTFGKLRYVFEMEEAQFFEAYAGTADGKRVGRSIVSEWAEEDSLVRAKIPELPFSNIWVAQHTAPLLPNSCELHLGILNTLRAWNFFETPESVECFANTGGFGIDGCVSSLIGASLANPERLYLGVVGDLAFFYDMNSLGNRHVGSNVRLMVVNNGVGTEFKNYNHPAAAFEDSADAFMAARGHYGAQSPDLLRHYATDLGFEYLAASSKEEYLACVNRFVDPNPHDQPLVFEVFTDSRAESEALQAVRGIVVDARTAAKQAAKRMIGDKGVRTVKKMLGR